MSTLDPSSLKVTELKDELRNRGLPIKGKKDELIARLNEAIQSDNNNSNNDNAANETIEVSTDKPAEVTTEESSKEEPNAEEVVEETVEEIVEKPAEVISEKPKEEILEKSTEVISEKPKEEILEEPTNEISEKPKEEILEKAMEGTSKEPEEKSVQISEEKVIETVVEEPRHVQQEQIIEKIVVEPNHVQQEQVIEKKSIDIVEKPEAEATKAQSPEQMNTDKNSKRKLSADETIQPEEKRSKIESTPGCSALYVKGFVRPLINRAVQEMFGKYGKVKRFWIDFIKTHSYVIYETEEEASLAFDNINGIVFPQDTGKTLTAGKLTLDQAEKLIEYEQAAASNHLRIDWEPLVEKVKAGESLPVSPGSGNNARSARSIGMDQINKQLSRAVEPTSTPSRQITIAKPVEAPKERSLDDLFRKTTTLPHLYYLPVSDEEAQIKLNAIKLQRGH